jgi:hypothetical protein
VDVVVPPKLRLMMRAPWSTANEIAAASSTSEIDPSPAPALTTISFASPPKPAIPSPFVTDPAASAATNVPCPRVSRTSAVPVRGLNVVGFFAAMSGALTSAPVSTTAIVTELAARCTQSGTRSSRAARNCHSHGVFFPVAA